MSENTHPVSMDATVFSQIGMQDLFDLSSPQSSYQALIEQGGLVRPVEGLALSFSRPDTEFVLRNHEVFTNRVEMNMGNARPLIPLNVDPPRHSKYRKLLDPLFAPRRMEEQEQDITRRANGFIDQFIERGECNFTEEFAEVFPASVFLGLLGLPEEELRMFLRLRDGVLHPEKMDPDAVNDFDKRAAIMNATGQEIYDYFSEYVRLRQKEPANDIITRFLATEIDGEKLTPD